MKLPFAFRILQRFTREGIPHLNDKERCMTQSIPDDGSIEIVDHDDPYRHCPKAKPEQRIIRGMDPEKIFGILADVDDAFLDDVTAIRRAERAAKIAEKDNPFWDLPDEADDKPGRTDALAASGRMRDPYRDWPRAKPGMTSVRGMDPEKIFGICADELDDQFLEDVMAARRAERARGGRDE
jgi:hypothetical protein